MCKTTHYIQHAKYGDKSNPKVTEGSAVANVHGSINAVGRTTASLKLRITLQRLYKSGKKITWMIY